MPLTCTGHRRSTLPSDSSERGIRSRHDLGNNQDHLRLSLLRLHLKSTYAVGCRWSCQSDLPTPWLHTTFRTTPCGMDLTSFKCLNAFPCLDTGAAGSPSLQDWLPTAAKGLSCSSSFERPMLDCTRAPNVSWFFRHNIWNPSPDGETRTALFWSPQAVPIPFQGAPIAESLQRLSFPCIGSLDIFPGLPSCHFGKP